MKQFSKSPKVRKMASPPRVPPESKVITGKTDKMISPRSSTHSSNLPLNTKAQLSKKSETSYKQLDSLSINQLKENVKVPSSPLSPKIGLTSSKMLPPQSIPSAMYKIQEFGLEYEGEMKDDKFEGVGILRDPKEPKNRYIYKGEWKNGARNGKGHYIYPDYSEYTGEWENNLKHGVGSYVSSEGDYQGEWAFGQRNGKGILNDKNSHCILDGQWRNDEFVGGKVTYEDGSAFSGSMREYMRDGQGEYKYEDGSQYSGEWLSNQKSGKGSLKFSNGDIYDGEFRKGKRHGKKSRYIWKENQYQIVDAEYDDDEIMGGQLYDGVSQRVMKEI